MTLAPETVERIALLARLQLGAEELETMTVQLGRIVQYVEQLSELDTDDVAPMAHAIDMANVLVDDEPADSLPRSAALANAPKHDGECFRVPAVL